MITQIKETRSITTSELAEYVLFKYGPMSQLKLQKLLYYTQAYHLAYFDVPLFVDDFEAWVHGPVLKSLFQEYLDQSVLYNDIKYISDNGQPSPEINLIEKLTSEQLQLINDVLDGYASLTSFELENETHSEQPWIEARKGLGQADKCSNIITKDTMKVFYKKRLDAET